MQTIGRNYRIFSDREYTAAPFVIGLIVGLVSGGLILMEVWG